MVCEYAKFPEHFGFFLPLAGITTVKQIRESAFDIKATGRLNRLYVELLKHNPEWDTGDRRHDMNHFMARLIFCFFAEDTDIFHPSHPFTGTVEQMSARDSSNTHEVISELFRAMDTPIAQRAGSGLRPWADAFPYVNGHLFSGSVEVPRFSRIARSYLLHVGNLDWTKINPDIFGSMIQAIAEDEERGALGLHYTSVPNILKVLNPLFLDDLRDKLGAAGTNKRKLANLRKRLAKIRVFDPACGSGNFLVIAYKQMREIERRIIVAMNGGAGTVEELLDTHSWPGEKSVIPLTNFRGIELRDFPAEIARLALIIAEYQCDVLYRGQKEALVEFLPLAAENWITCGNALRLDWLSLMDVKNTGVKTRGDDLFGTPLDQTEIDFENEGGETYICGNPPYLGSTWQSALQKSDLEAIFGQRTRTWKSLDYVAGWFMKAAEYATVTNAAAAFVATNSICQGQQVPILWPLIFETGNKIAFAHTSFKWANLASNKAGVTVAIIGIAISPGRVRRLFMSSEISAPVVKNAVNINAYLVDAVDVWIEKSARPISRIASMDRGNSPVDGGNLLLSGSEVGRLDIPSHIRSRFVRRIYGSAEFIRGQSRHCLWIDDAEAAAARAWPTLNSRIKAVEAVRLESRKAATRAGGAHPHRFDEKRQVGNEEVIAVPRISSEARAYLPVGVLPKGDIITDLLFALYDAPLWNMALIASKLHLVWIATVCGKLKTDYRYSNTLGWNTFPVPKLTEKNKADLTRCAEDILLAREAHFPATIADLYDPEKMPADLRAAHDRNDEVLERIYIGRRFKNDTERLEKLFELYTKMTKAQPAEASATS